MTGPGGRLLGAVLAGGRSSRFGSDKAVVPVDGRAMLDHVVAGLAPQVDALVLCGREWPGVETIADRPEPGLGPLGGLCAALRHAADNGYDRVITAPVDVIPFPADISALLLGSDALVFREQYLIGGWPAALADRLDAHLSSGARSVRSWIELAGARFVAEPAGLRNVNRPDDLDQD